MFSPEIAKIYFSCLDLRVFKPLMVPGFPENTTAVVGGQAKLVCKVHRPLSTKVQWLKKEASVSGQTLEGPPRPRELTVSKLSLLILFFPFGTLP